MTEEKRQNLQKSGLVEWSVFSELIAMDEDEEGFSKGLFQTFVDQFIETFQEIDENVKKQNLDKLSSLGHYLKGSAAALGLVKISSQCERIQNYGHKNNFDNFELPAKSEKEPPKSSDSKDKTPSDKKEPENGTAKSKTEPLKDTDDEFWIKLIEDALDKARVGFEKSRAAINEYFDDEL